MSWEEGFAWRAARFYGPDLCRAGREQRIGASRERIALLEARTREERAAHKAGCDRCFCMTAMAYTPEQSGRSDRVQFMRQLIASEEQDEAYARAARSHPVQYRNHVDGFCRYWQNLPQIRGGRADMRGVPRTAAVAGRSGKRWRADPPTPKHTSNGEPS
jgi:hypothetical protein